MQAEGWKLVLTIPGKLDGFQISRFASEVDVPADVFRFLVLRRNLKTDSFPALHTEREVFSCFHVAQMGNAMLVMVHPIHTVFGNRRPRPKPLPEHIRSFDKSDSNCSVDPAPVLRMRKNRRLIKVRSF
jgi:hypothetical protein